MRIILLNCGAVDETSIILYCIPQNYENNEKSITTTYNISLRENINEKYDLKIHGYYTQYKIV